MDRNSVRCVGCGKEIRFSTNPPVSWLAECGHCGRRQQVEVLLRGKARVRVRP